MAFAPPNNIIRDILLSKLPSPDKCGKEAATTLAELLQLADHFNRNVTPGYAKQLTPDRKKAYTEHPNYKQAEGKVKELMARLRDQHKINLHGIMCTTMEFCGHFSEAYAMKYPH
jgi:hypothetical protein